MSDRDLRPDDTTNATPGAGDGAWWCSNCQEFALLTNYLCGDCTPAPKAPAILFGHDGTTGGNDDPNG